MIPLPAKLAQRIVALENGCWQWTGAHEGGGYGNVRWNGKNIKVHRLLYICYQGYIPKGLELDHLCRNKGCCNPGHLEAVSHKINVSRGDLAAANSSRKLSRFTCPSGHPYAGSNLYIEKDGSRRCRTCGRERKRKR